MTKVCIECKKQKPLSEFHLKAKSTLLAPNDKHRTKCKECCDDSRCEYQSTKNFGVKCNDWSYLKQLTKRNKYGGIE